MRSSTSAPHLVLASASTARRRLLQRLGVSFEAVSHACDESEARPQKPAAVAGSLAARKAASLQGRWPDSFILGSDQIVLHQGEIVEKPGSVENAMRQLARLSGGTHELITAVCLQRPDGGRSSAETRIRMTMRSLSEDEILRYLAVDKPLDCCGSYKIESLGIALFDRIEADDFTGIEGLPLMQVAAMLREVGFKIP